MLISGKRYVYWDNIKGLLIALVVFAHCLYAFQDKGTINSIVDSIYCFHMPAFVFVSGFFSKSDNSRSARSLLKLFSAYLLLIAVHMALALAMGEKLMITRPYYSAWYLLALIVWRLITPYFSKVKRIIPLLLIASLLAGFWQGINNDFAFARIISFYPFFLAGYFLPVEKAEGIVNKPLKSRLPAGIVILAAGLLMAAATIHYLHPNETDFLFGSYADDIVTDVMTRTALFATAPVCIIGILLITPDVRIPLLSKAGRNTLAIFVIHRPITLILNRCLSSLPTRFLLLEAAVFTVLAMLILGSDRFAAGFNKILTFISEGFMSAGNGEKKDFAKKAVVLLLLFGMLAVPAIRFIIYYF